MNATLAPRRTEGENSEGFGADEGCIIFVKNDTLHQRGRGCFIGCQAGRITMADEHKNEQERRVSVEDMPAEVRQLSDAMLGVNPNWNVHDWIVEQANIDGFARP